MKKVDFKPTANPLLYLVVLYVFYLAPHQLQAVTYSFNFSGNWNTAARWSGGVIPPNPLPAGDEIIIKANCTQNVDVTISPGANMTINTSVTLTINAGFILNVQGSFANNGSVSVLGTFRQSSTGTANNGGVITNSSGSVFANNGTFNNNSSGIVTNNNGSSFTNSSTFNNNSGGTINNNSGADVQNSGTFNNNTGGVVNNGGIWTNNGTFENKASGTFNNNSPGIYTNASLTVNAGLFANNSGANLDNAVGTFKVPAGGNLDNAGTLVNSAQLTNEGSIDNTSFFRNNGTGNFDNSGTFFNSSTGTVIHQGLITNTSTITNNGTLGGIGGILGNFTNNGKLVPGNSPGTFDIFGNYTANPASTHVIEIAGTGAGDYDVISVVGTANLSGVLSVSLINGFIPSIGDVFVVLDANAISGSFTTALPAGYTWNVTYTGGDVTLEVLGILPVDLLSFVAQTKQSGVVLSWQTASETNNKGFYVQRSQNADSWENMGFAEGKGTTETAASYSLRDDAPYAGLNYYRLVQEDFDGKQTTSETLSIRFEGLVGSLELYPNPSRSGAPVRVRSDYSQLNDGMISICDINGKVLHTYEQTGLEMNTSGLAPGLYIVRLSAEGLSVSKRLIVQ